MDLSDPVVLDVIGQAPQLYVSMLGSSGDPVVTPELYAHTAGQLWALTARGTMKGRTLADGDEVGVAVFNGRQAVVLQCTVQRYDITEPSALLGKLRELGDATTGVVAFLARNGIEMVGAARDAVLGRLGSPTPDVRVLLALEPNSISVGESDGVDAVVGWCSTTGAPLALPARWSEDDRVASVDSALFDAVSAMRSGPASVCIDHWSGTGPSGKQGSLLRGSGTVANDNGSTAITINVDRITTWDGVAVSTEKT